MADRKKRVPRALIVVLATMPGVGGFYAWSVNQAMPREDLMPDDSPLPRTRTSMRAPTWAPSWTRTHPGHTSEGEADAEGEDADPTIEGGVAEPDGSVNPGRPGPGAAGTLNYLLLGTDSRGAGDRGRSDLMINFDGFIGLTDAVGGVTVNNKHASPGFPRGPVTLQRKNLPRGDLDRAERQRLVLEAIMGKVLSPETLANPARFNAVAGRLRSFVTADAGLTNGEIMSTASMRLSGRGDIVSLQAPIAGFSRSRGGQAINLVDWPKMRATADGIRHGTLAG